MHWLVPPPSSSSSWGPIPVPSSSSSPPLVPHVLVPAWSPSSSSSSPELAPVKACIAVSRTWKFIVPMGVRPVFASRLKYASLNPRNWGPASTPSVLGDPELWCTWIVYTEAVSSGLYGMSFRAPHDQKKARSSVPTSDASAVKSTGAPRPPSNRSPFNVGRGWSTTLGLVGLNSNEYVCLPWPRETGSRHGWMTSWTVF